MSITTAGLAPAAFEPLVDDVRLAVVAAPGASARWTFDDGVLEVRSAADLEIRLAVPIGDAVGFWHPVCGWRRTLVADWDGFAHPSLVRGAAAGCLYDSSGASMLAFLAEDSVPEVRMRYGVSEETNTFIVHIGVPAGAVPYRLLLAERGGSVASSMRALRERLTSRTGALSPVPEGARVPVYNTWYAFSQDVTAQEVEAEAELAAELGFGTIIVDDGWQRLATGRGYAGVGDWVPDAVKFPDLRAHVAKVRALGLKYLLWVAPMLIGTESECFAELEQYAPAEQGPPGSRVLDPRRPEVRAHVVQLCKRLVTDYHLDGLKIDFVDEVMFYSGRDDAGIDVTDVGAAMQVLLTELWAALGPEALIELRQPYIGPGVAEFGNMLRAYDCAGDAVANRIRTIDVGMLAVRGAVHSDMAMWDEAGDVRSAVRQLVGGFHSVPQVSVKLSSLSPVQSQAVRFWLGQWRRLRPLLLDGDVEPSRPDELYPVVVASSGEECAITVTADRVVPLDTDRHRHITVINSTACGRVVLEVSGPGGVFETVVHDAAGSVIDRSQSRLEPGLLALELPASGLVVLERVA
ncbi:hypothetical protein GCM10010441_17680 [Kitasatospora paracochleata]